MTEHKYHLEQIDDKTWMVYKVNVITEKTEVGYQVELDSHGPGAHQCSCPFGTVQKDGQTTKFCKHIKYVFDAQNQNKK